MKPAFHSRAVLFDLDGTLIDTAPDIAAAVDRAINRYFALSIGADDLPEKKPHPAPLLHVAAAFALKPGECLMVGDSVNDVEAARAAGMPVIAVSYGYNHGAPIADSRPDAVVDRFAQLADLIAV